MRRSVRGFTLVEILVVIGVLSVVLGLGVRFLFIAQDHQRQRYAQDELSLAAGVIFETMRADFAAIPSSTLAQATLRGQPGSVPAEPPFQGAELADDTVVMPVHSHRETGETGLAMYVINREGAYPVLTRRSGPAGEAEPGGPEEVLQQHVSVRQFRAAFLSGEGQWLAEWPAGEGAAHPQAVRVSLALADPDDPRLQVAREAVFRIYPK